jgi:hypothetical protein
MRDYLVITGFIAVSLFASQAMAGKVQPISQETAQSLCKEGGYSAGTTTCGFCHGNHCHSVDCNESGKCFNTTYSPPRTSSGGGPGKIGLGTGAVVSGQAGAKMGNNPPAKLGASPVVNPALQGNALQKSGGVGSPANPGYDLKANNKAR